MKIGFDLYEPLTLNAYDDIIFCRVASDPPLLRYAKIAMLLKDKTTRDVALRVRWMIVSCPCPIDCFLFIMLLKMYVLIEFLETCKR